MAEPADVFDPRHYEGLGRPPLEAATPPSWYYTGEAFHAREVERIFRRAWNCVGRLERVPRPGDYAAFDLAGVPLVVVRDRGGRVRAFANSCRHRGTILLEGAGNCRAIKCPYHGWVYGLDGALTGAPGMEDSLDFRREDWGLVPVRLETMGGFMFVNLDTDTASLEDYLGDFPETFAPWNLEDMVTVRRREFEVACNWKASAEVFMEYYHSESVHPDSLYKTKRIANPPDAVTGEYATMFSDHEGSRALIEGRGHEAFPPIATLAGRARHGTRFTLVYPSLVFGCTIDAMWFIECYPQGPGRTRYAHGACFPKAVVERPDFGELVAGYYERFDAAVNEDNMALERQHKGLSSPFAGPGRLSHLEPIVAMLGQWVTDRVIGNEA